MSGNAVVILTELIRRVLASDLLSKELVFLPSRGALDADLKKFSIPQNLRDLLVWRNGMDLDVVRIHGVGAVEVGITPIAMIDGRTVIASDPAGFQYFLAADGSVACYDHDGGAITRIADDVGAFFGDYMFGARAAEFAGPEWAEEVNAALGAG